MAVSERDLIDQLADIGDNVNGLSQAITAQKMELMETLNSVRGSIDIAGKNIAQSRESSRQLVIAVNRLTKYGLWVAVVGLLLATGHLVLGFAELLAGWR